MTKLTLAVLIVFCSLQATNAQNSLLVGDVYDFDINDEFHYTITHYMQGPRPVWRRKIIEKYYSAGQDTLFYVCIATGYSGKLVLWDSVDWSSYYFHDTLIISNLDSAISTMLPLPSSELNSPLFVFSDTILSSPASFCNILMYHYSLKNSSTQETKEYYGSFGKGLGENYFHRYDPNTYQIHFRWQMFYFSKDTFSCGTPDYRFLSDEPQTIPTNDIKVFPNPANTHFNLQIALPLQNLDISIYDLQGRLVKELILPDTGEPVDIITLPAGLYLLKIGSDRQYLGTVRLLKSGE